MTSEQVLDTPWHSSPVDTLGLIILSPAGGIVSGRVCWFVRSLVSSFGRVIAVHDGLANVAPCK